VAEPVETDPCEQDCGEANNSDSLKNCKIFDLNKHTDSITIEHSSGGEQNVNPVIHTHSEQTSELHRMLSDISNMNKPSLQSKAIEIIQGADAAGVAAPTNEEPVHQHRHESVDVMECGSGLTNTVSDDDCSDKNVYVSLGKLNNCKTDNASDCVSEVYPSIAGDARRNFQCPLCWKTFEKNEAQVLHMKACALRHNVTTRQLLDAVELQGRQAAGRQALGLPDIPTTRIVKKSSSKKVIYRSLI
jgi:intracellular sulfur oxidation DsrE/DsrF family protein